MGVAMLRRGAQLELSHELVVDTNERGNALAARATERRVRQSGRVCSLRRPDLDEVCPRHPERQEQRVPEY